MPTIIHSWGRGPNPAGPGPVFELGAGSYNLQVDQPRGAAEPTLVTIQRLVSKEPDISTIVSLRSAENRIVSHAEVTTGAEVWEDFVGDGDFTAAAAGTYRLHFGPGAAVLRLYQL